MQHGFLLNQLKLRIVVMILLLKLNDNSKNGVINKLKILSSVTTAEVVVKVVSRAAAIIPRPSGLNKSCKNCIRLTSCNCINILPTLNRMINKSPKPNKIMKRLLNSLKMVVANLLMAVNRLAKVEQNQHPPLFI